MIDVVVGDEIRPGIFQFTVPEFQLSGASRQPLLDACRMIAAAGGDGVAGLIRNGRCDLTVPVRAGAGLTVKERPNGPRFEKWHPYPTDKIGQD